MIAILKRELRSLCHSIYGILFFGLFLFACGIFMSVFHFSYGYGNFEFVLSYMTVALFLLLPLLSVPLFYFEARQGTDRLLESLPISRTSVFLGKLCGMLVPLGGLTVLLSLCPLVLGMLGEVHYGAAYAAIFGWLILGITVVSLDFFLAVLLRGRRVAWAVTYGVAVGLLVLSGIGTRFFPPLGRWLSDLSLVGTYTHFSFGLFDGCFLIYNLVLSALLVLGAFLLFKRRSNLSKQKKETIGGVSLLVACVLFLSLGLQLIPTKYRRIDMTHNKIYTLTEETETYLETLGEPVTIYLLEADGSDYQFECFLEKLCGIGDRITLKKATEAEKSELLSRLEITAEIPSYTIIAESEKRTATLGYMELFSYRTDNEALNSLGLTEMTAEEYFYYASLFEQDEQYASYLSALVNDCSLYFRGEEMLLSMLEYVSAEIIPTHYVLTGHGEAELSKTIYASMLSTYGQTYELLNIASVTSIPEDAASLLLVAPASDYSAEEISKLQAYLDGGGSLSVVTEQSQLVLPNLMALLSEYGLTAKQGLVCEERTVLDEEEESEPTTEIVSSVEVTVNTDHDAMAGAAIEDDFVPVITGGNPIIFGKGRDESLLLTPILTTSEHAMLGDDPATKGEKILAAAAETANGTKLLWFTGAESFCVSSELISEELSGIYNAYCLYLARGWHDLSYEMIESGAEAKQYGSTYLQMSDASSLMFIFITSILIPFGVMGIGAIYRSKRKKA